MEAIVRRLVASDSPRYVALRREMLLDSPWAFAASPEDDRGLDPEALAADLASPGSGIAIVGSFDERGNLTGSAGLTRSRHVKMAHRAHIWGVYVTPSARGRGTAEAILHAAFDVARSWPGVTSVGLSVSENSPAARRLYERLGFIAWGLEPDALHLDGRSFAEVHMYRPL